MFNDLENHGFLPRSKPLQSLPREFSAVQELITKAPVHIDGQPVGYLAQNKFRSIIKNGEFPDLTKELQAVDPDDYRLQAALFRDYGFLSAMYMLEGCHKHFLETGDYGLAEDHLPRSLSVPMKLICERLKYKKPIHDYSYGYGLGNWHLINDPNPDSPDYHNDQIVPDDKWALKNLSAIRAFNGCSDEDNFQAIHVAIDSKSHLQIEANQQILDGVMNQDRELFNQGMLKLGDTLQTMSDIFFQMWKVSNPKNYLQFRTFIMGIEGNTDLFPNGVVYQGCWDEKPQYFRGETGAQDSIIPTCDSILNLNYPKNNLTKYLWELRDYRPQDHQAYIEKVRKMSAEHGVYEFALQDSTSAAAMLRAMHLTFGFRHMHWNMVQKYIIDNTKYPKATGGTPITTWLPNQMGACLEFCEVLMDKVDPNQLAEGEAKDDFLMRREKIKSQIIKLFEEVHGYQSDFHDQEHDQFTTRDKEQVNH